MKITYLNIRAVGMGLLGILFLTFSMMWVYAEFQIVYLENVMKHNLDTKITSDLYISIENGTFRSLCKSYSGELLFGFDRCEIAHKEMCKIPKYQEYCDE